MDLIKFQTINFRIDDTKVGVKSPKEKKKSTKTVYSLLETTISVLKTQIFKLILTLIFNKPVHQIFQFRPFNFGNTVCILKLFNRAFDVKFQLAELSRQFRLTRLFVAVT